MVMTPCASDFSDELEANSRCSCDDIGTISFEDGPGLC